VPGCLRRDCPTCAKLNAHRARKVVPTTNLRTSHAKGLMPDLEQGR